VHDTWEDIEGQTGGTLSVVGSGEKGQDPLFCFCGGNKNAGWKNWSSDF